MTDFSLTAMMYHYVREPGDAAEAGSGVPGLPTSQFEAQLDYLSQNYDMIAWPDLRAYLQDGKPLPPRACMLTFDDGICDHYLNAFPAMHKRGLSGLFFAMAARPGGVMPFPHKIHFVQAKIGLDGMLAEIMNGLNEGQRERYQVAEAKYSLWFRSPVDVFKTIVQRDLMDDVEPIINRLFAEHVGSETETAKTLFLNNGQIKEMVAGGMHFGGHSQTHPWFDHINVDQLNVEIERSADWLKDVEPEPWAFAYPYGGLTNDAPPLLAAHGFGAAFTTRDKTQHADRFFIGRIDGEELVVESASHA